MYDYVVEEASTGDAVNVWSGGKPYVGMCIEDSSGAMWRVADYCYVGDYVYYILVEFDFDY